MTHTDTHTQREKDKAILTSVYCSDVIRVENVMLAIIFWKKISAILTSPEVWHTGKDGIELLIPLIPVGKQPRCLSCLYVM